MTFFKSKERDKEKLINGNQNSSLLDDSNLNITRLFEDIELKFLEFNKFYNILVEFNRKIPFFTKKEYEKTKDDAHDKIQIIPNILKQINISFNEIQEYSSELNIQTIQKLDIIREKISPKVSYLPTLIELIYEREKVASLKLNNITLNESQLDDSLSFLHNKSDRIRDSKLNLKEVISNQNYLEKRKEELEMIKQVSSQLKEITFMMGDEVKLQGAGLNHILEDIEVIRENVINAENQLKKADKQSSKNLKKIIFLSLAIFITLGVIITIICLIIYKI